MPFQMQLSSSPIHSHPQHPVLPRWRQVLVGHDQRPQSHRVRLKKWLEAVIGTTWGLHTFRWGSINPVDFLSVGLIPSTFHHTLNARTEVRIPFTRFPSLGDHFPPPSVLPAPANRRRPRIIQLWEWIRRTDSPPVYIDFVPCLKGVMTALRCETRFWLRKRTRPVNSLSTSVDCSDATL